ncbi:MAG: sulfotransferase [Methylococcales bacterium]
MEIIQKTGFTIFRPRLLQQRINTKHTTVIAGSSRGGTSVIAYALARTGFNLGQTNDINHEDTEILKVFRNKSALRTIFNERNAAYDVWGFKVPESTYYFDWLDIQLRNPIFIYVVRNPASIARSIFQRHPVYGKGLDGYVNSFEHGLRYYSYFAETLRRMQSPTLIIEHEAIVHNPIDFCQNFYTSLGIEINSDLLSDIAQNISTPGYKKIK